MEHLSGKQISVQIKTKAYLPISFLRPRPTISLYPLCQRKDLDMSPHVLDFDFESTAWLRLPIDSLFWQYQHLHPVILCNYTCTKNSVSLNETLTSILPAAYLCRHPRDHVIRWNGNF